MLQGTIQIMALPWFLKGIYLFKKLLLPFSGWGILFDVKGSWNIEAKLYVAISPIINCLR